MMQQPGFSLVIRSVKTFLIVLNSVRLGVAKQQQQQVCSFVVSAAGLFIRTAADSKDIEAEAFLRADAFAVFLLRTAAEGQRGEAGGGGGGAAVTFDVFLSAVYDTLQVFTAAPQRGGLRLSYPGPNGELILETVEDAVSDAPGGFPVTTCVYARIATLAAGMATEYGGAAAAGDATSFEAYWEDPTSYFMTQSLGSQLLAEAVADLAWLHGDVELSLATGGSSTGRQAGWGAVAGGGAAAEELRISISGRSASQGAMEVDIPPRAVVAFELASSTSEGPSSSHVTGAGLSNAVQHRYRYRSIAAAFCNLPTPKDCLGISSKVRLDRKGLLKATHILSLTLDPAAARRSAAGDFFSPRGGGGGGGAFKGRFEEPAERESGPSTTVSVSYILLPMTAEAGFTE